MDKYVRITGNDFNNYTVIHFLDKVGIATCVGDRNDGNGTMFSVKMGAIVQEFHEWNIKFITKKEYFLGVLKHGYT